MNDLRTITPKRDIARELARKYSTMTHDELDILEGILEPVKYGKGEMILTEGEVCRGISYIEKGLVRQFYNKNGKEVKHRIFSVPHFGNTFPDQQDVQIVAASRHGVAPVQNREEAEHSKGKLVYVGSNPFFYVDKLNNSIPYLVPRASVLLQDIGRAYFDSLQIKGIPLHKIIVTSILRTKDDVSKLRTRNGNATENSCHLYGTTFDICYNRYKQIQTEKQPRRQVQNDTLKWVFSEVLRDIREKNRCYIKYEVKQGCFHITVK